MNCSALILLWEHACWRNATFEGTHPSTAFASAGRISTTPARFRPIRCGAARGPLVPQADTPECPRVRAASWMEAASPRASPCSGRPVTACARTDNFCISLCKHSEFRTLHKCFTAWEDAPEC
jgi:hypothetical protein